MTLRGKAAWREKCVSWPRFGQRDARRHRYGEGRIVVPGDLAARSGAGRAAGRGGQPPGMLGSVGRVPMAPEHEFV